MDHSRFEDIYRDHARFVNRIVASRIHAPADRDDVFQEVWMNIYTSFGNFAGRSKLSTWIYGVARFTLLRHLEKRRPEEAHATLDDLPAADPGPAGTEAGGRILELIGRLTPEQQEAVNLYYLEERPYAEIARRLGLDLSTVKSRLHEARKRIRDWMTEDGR